MGLMGLDDVLKQTSQSSNDLMKERERFHLENTAILGVELCIWAVD
jgi:hypothetical protein